MIMNWVEAIPNSIKEESFGDGNIGFLKFDHFARRLDPNNKYKESNYAIFDSFLIKTSSENGQFSLLG